MQVFLDSQVGDFWDVKSDGRLTEDIQLHKMMTAFEFISYSTLNISFILWHALSLHITPVGSLTIHLPEYILYSHINSTSCGHFTRRLAGTILDKVGLQFRQLPFTHAAHPENYEML